MSEALKIIEPVEIVEAVERTLVRCLVCGCSEIRTDEVFEHGWLLLAECSRCDHRWTQGDDPRSGAIRARRAVRIDREVASAA